MSGDHVPSALSSRPVSQFADGEKQIMKITILGGTGRMGRGLARTFLKAGHEVILGSRNSNSADREAANIKRDLPQAAVRGTDLKSAASDGNLIVLAVPFRDAAGLVASLADSLEGKIILDITNPFGAVPRELSGVQHNAKALRRPARWVAAYKTNFWKTLSQPTDRQGMRRDVFICSDDADTRDVVGQLVEATGFRAVDCGSLENAKVLDPMVPLMLELDDRFGGNASSSWKFLDSG